MINFIKTLWTASIQRQLMLGIILVHAVLMTVFVYDLVERQSKFLNEQSIDQTHSLAGTLAANSVSWLLANDVVGLEEILESQNHYPGIRYAMVINLDGRVLAHTDVNKVGLYLSDKVSHTLLRSEYQKQTLVSTKKLIDVASPIFSNDQVIGWARVGLGQEKIVKGLNIITFNGVIYILIAILIGAIFAYFMAKGITRGLHQLVEVTEEIKQGNFTRRSTLERKDELGQVSHNFNLMLDTIDESNQKLKEAYKENDRILATIDDVLYRVDLNGNLILWNDHLCEVTGLTDKEILNRPAYKFFPDYEKDKIIAVIKEGFETGFVEVEADFITVDGIRHYEFKGRALYNNDEVVGITGIGRDITDRLISAKEKLSLENQLLQAQKLQAIGQLTGGIAHDFNNILAIILGFTELSQDLFADKDEKLKEYLEEIYKAGKRGSELIGQMMMFSRKDQTERHELEVFNITPLIKETTKMLASTFPASMQIKLIVEDSHLHAKINPVLMSQILINLCINARDSMDDKGLILITITETHTDNLECGSCHDMVAGDYVVISIKDTGTGIKPELLKRVFDPFFTTKDVGKGTGMGLSVVHGIVHNLNGHILVESEQGKGTNIKVLLPAIIEEKSTTNKSITEKKRHDLTGTTIMIVDDEPSVANYLTTLLEKAGANILMHTDSEAALKEFTSMPDKVDLVVSDQTMPMLTGVDMLSAMLKIKPSLPTILCTGYSATIDEETALSLGIKAFILKPINVDDFLSVINKYR